MSSCTGAAGCGSIDSCELTNLHCVSCGSSLPVRSQRRSLDSTARAEHGLIRGRAANGSEMAYTLIAAQCMMGPRAFVVDNLAVKAFPACRGKPEHHGVLFAGCLPLCACAQADEALATGASACLMLSQPLKLTLQACATRWHRTQQHLPTPAPKPSIQPAPLSTDSPALSWNSLGSSLSGTKPRRCASTSSCSAAHVRRGVRPHGPARCRSTCKISQWPRQQHLTETQALPGNTRS